MAYLDSPCWIWPGTRNAGGYAVRNLKPQSSVPNLKRHSLAWKPSTLVHRHAYQLLVGPIPDGLVLDHLCRQRACINPAHLEPVTVAENALRATHRGRRPYREPLQLVVEHAGMICINPPDLDPLLTRVSPDRLN